ncbi:T9SS type A sorting domain-containing protein [Rubrivirga marina]|uniref:Secretion system C-terminal sorting domain-containing protein n=1 Tax=Rubrivirga marina TaxID=1196024 RepID=A0A271IZ48_9BACT|nr:T9SS type A sorting domain-containing protein [Rubrivirga marina]PAP76482.1 hypothetical protein BSZ37_08530 [Rubrivirga marina]
MPRLLLAAPLALTLLAADVAAQSCASDIDGATVCVVGTDAPAAPPARLGGGYPDMRDSVAVDFTVRSQEAFGTNLGDEAFFVAVYAQWTHIEGTPYYSVVANFSSGPRRASGWSGGGVTSRAPDDSFPEVINAPPGTLISPRLLYITRRFPGSTEEEWQESIAQTRAAAASYGPTYYLSVSAALDPALTTTISLPEEVAAGEEFEATVEVSNKWRVDAEIVRAAGPLVVRDTAGVEVEGAVEIAEEPEPLAVVGGPSTGSLPYTLVARKAGRFVIEAPVEAVWPRYYSNVVASESVCGEEDQPECAVEVTGAELVVNDEGDEPDDDLDDDGFCDVDPGEAGSQCTLRAALQTATAAGGALIAFDLEVPTIAIESALPPLTDGVTLDGETQPGTAGLPSVRIDGSGAGGADGLRVEGNSVTVRGLAITGFGGHGIHVAGGVNGVLEGLLIGTDATGAEGLGNGGDGIHVSGGSGLRIGDEESTRRRSAINLGVISVSNLLNGLYVRDPANATRIRARREGRAAAEARILNINVAGLTAGLFDALGTPKALPNGQNGVCLLGARGVTFRKPIISDAARHAFEVLASQDVRILGGLLGLRRPQPTAAAHIGSIGQSLVRVVESLGVAVGSGSEADGPVQGVGSGGWFMDVEASEDVQVRNVLAGITQNIDAIGGPLAALLRNRAGGLRVFNSPNVTVGLEGLATVFANNGGDGGQPQAGIFAAGPFTQNFRALGVHLGTTPTGQAGLGNLGSGLVLADGVRDAILGGDSPLQQLVSGGNGGYGFLFRDLAAPEGLRRADGSVINILSGTRLLSGILGGPVGGTVGETLRVPNALSGFCMLRVRGALLRALSAGPNGRHGIEILQSEGIQIPSARIGSLFDKLLASPEDVAAPEADGVHVANSVLISLGQLSGGPLGSFLIHGVGGRGMAFQGSRQITASGVGVGKAPVGSSMAAQMQALLGPGSDGGWFMDTDDVRLDSLTVLGAGRLDGVGGGLLFNGGRFARIARSLLGERGPGGLPARASAGPAVRVTALDSLQLLTSRILGHTQGLVAHLSTALLDGNTFEGQGDGGAGDAVQQTGGSVEAVRNTFIGAEGAAVRIDAIGEMLLRFNNIAGNVIGVLAEGSGGGREGGARVLAPDNWWGDPSGPSGDGPGAGDSVFGPVDYGDWLTEAGGVVVTPSAYVVEAGDGEDVEVTLAFESPFVGDDVVDVTVTDEQGWITSATSFSIGTSAEHTLTATVGAADGDAVRIRAVSQSDPSLAGSATVRIVPPGGSFLVESDSEPGATELDALGVGTMVAVGGKMVVNPGGANEEEATVSGFGSVLFDAPLRFRHRRGERVVPADAFAVSSEPDPVEELPTALAVAVAPNPAGYRTVVTVAVPGAGPVRAVLYDALGREVARLHDGPLAAGTRALPIDASRLRSGVYVVRVEAGGEAVSRALTVVR